MSTAPYTPADLTSCDQEPIHIPGSIQPHGMMLVAARHNFRVLQVGGDIESRLGIAEWENKPLEMFIGSALIAGVAVRAERQSDGNGFIGQFKTLTGEVLDVSACVSGSYIIVELERASTAGLPSAYLLDELAAATTRFERAGSLTTLCERAAVEFRELTMFDRVMVYRFLDDGAGKVIAEDRRTDLHPFLNHHYPASDIPRQARALYIRNLIRVIPDASYQAIALRPSGALEGALDMSDSSLRSVSPVHLEYLKNMGVKASASVSIVMDGVLWGLIACHHETPKSLTYDIRAACRSLAGSLSRQIKAKEEAEGYQQRIRLRGFEDDIVALLSRESSLGSVLSNNLSEISRMMSADGVAIFRKNDLVTFGVCPGEREIRDLVSWILSKSTEPAYWTATLSSVYTPAARFEHLGSGLLAVTISADEPWLLLWFRAEQAQSVNWAGNPHQSDGLNPQKTLMPRASFDVWQETVRGRAPRWSLAEVEAATRLRTSLQEVQQFRRVGELNRQLTKTLQDKDLLLQQKQYLIGEVNHRVQNSLQLVSSFLDLQARDADSPELHGALKEARQRISAVALVHRRLYRGDQIEIIDLARYCEELCADTFSFKGKDWAQHLTLNLSPVLASTDRAVTIGLDSQNY